MAHQTEFLPSLCYRFPSSHSNPAAERSRDSVLAGDPRELARAVNQVVS